MPTYIDGTAGAYTTTTTTNNYRWVNGTTTGWDPYLEWKTDAAAIRRPDTTSEILNMCEDIVKIEMEKMAKRFYKSIQNLLVEPLTEEEFVNILTKGDAE